MATLHDMQWYPVELDARTAGHEGSLADVAQNASLKII